MSSLPPPQYVLISQSTLPTEDGTDFPKSALIHPQIHYQYADDPPTAIPISLPSDAHVLYLDFNPSNPSHSQVRSASSSMVTADVSVSDAAGASATEHPHLYVISTGELRARNTPGDDPKALLRDYRERLDATRRVIAVQSHHTRLGAAP
ncbi:hypothetical protein OPQ81_010262 [Rhizoctonia solani]|nr:hypothetical protein OPQ81_010262 [Rhizoctonia solani]